MIRPPRRGGGGGFAVAVAFCRPCGAGNGDLRAFTRGLRPWLHTDAPSGRVRRGRAAAFGGRNAAVDAARRLVHAARHLVDAAGGHPGGVRVCSQGRKPLGSGPHHRTSPNGAAEAGLPRFVRRGRAAEARPAATHQPQRGGGGGFAVAVAFCRPCGAGNGDLGAFTRGLRPWLHTDAPSGRVRRGRGAAFGPRGGAFGRRGGATEGSAGTFGGRAAAFGPRGAATEGSAAAFGGRLAPARGRLVTRHPSPPPGRLPPAGSRNPSQGRGGTRRPRPPRPR